MNAPIVDWDVPTQPFRPVDRTVERLQVTCDVLRGELASQIQAKIDAERERLAARAVAQHILTQAQAEHLEHIALQERYDLLLACANDLLAALPHVSVDPMTMKLICNLNRAAVGR
jgi:hypothetical protein